MGRPAKITAYNKNLSTGACSDFSLNTYWGGGYKNIFYLCGDEGRPTFEDTIETVVDAKGQNIRTQNTTLIKYNLTLLAISPLLQFLKTIDKHDVKELEYLDTGDKYIITNIDINDQGERLDSVQLVQIDFEDEPVSLVSDNVMVLNSAKKAFWDNNNNGSQDINGLAFFSNALPNTYFSTWQLYFESDGITPANSGNIVIRVYAESPLSTPNNLIESLIGVFRGEFGDLFSDSTKWQSTQNIWDYFDLSNKVQHNGEVRFDKQQFAKDNGYFSDETEERAVNLRYELSINGSTTQKTNLALVYTIWGAFSSSGVQNSTSGEYGIVTVGKTDQKNTLSTYIDSYVPLPSGTNITVKSPVLSSFTNFSNTYTANVSPSNEALYNGSFTTPSGYIGTNQRGSFDNDNYTFSLNGIAPVFHISNVLAFNTGTTPLEFTFFWKYDRITSAGGFPSIGDTTGANDSTIKLDGVLVSIPPILAATQQIFGSQAILLPDTGVHTVEILTPTTGGYDIYTDFQVQAKPLY